MERTYEGMLRWYSRLLKMRDKRLAKKVFTFEVIGSRGKGKPEIEMV